MRQTLLRLLTIPLDWAIAFLELAIALLGCLRFFLASGASLQYVLERKRWFEATTLGRRMGLGDFLAFGAWHAETLRRRSL